jgi:putative heme transporter
VILTLLGFAVGDEAEDLGPTISDAVDDLEAWLVDDSPFEISREDIERYREDFRESIRTGARSSTGSIVSGAVVVGEVFLSLIIGLIVTFFAIKDGERFARWVQRQFPGDRQELVGRLGARAWRTLGGYLRGAATLGLVEGTIIGVAVALVGGRLAIPVGVFTFVMAFIPILGAIAAGAMAVLVALATGGTTAALIVLAVVIVVQQLDNDLLAPLVYGRSLELHPVTVLLAVAGGGALFGLPGTLLAVPVTAIALNALAEYRRAGREEHEGRPTPAEA